jgi:hypothetical protein
MTLIGLARKKEQRKGFTIKNCPAFGGGPFHANSREKIPSLTGVFSIRPHARLSMLFAERT